MVNHFLRLFSAALVILFTAGATAQPQSLPDAACLRTPDCLADHLIAAAPEMAPIKRLFQIAPDFGREFTDEVSRLVQSQTQGQPLNAGLIGQALFQKHIAVHAWKGADEHILGYWRTALDMGRHLGQVNPPVCVMFWNGPVEPRRLDSQGGAYLGQMIHYLALAFETGRAANRTPMDAKAFTTATANVFSRPDLAFSEEELDAIETEDLQAVDAKIYCAAMNKFMGALISPQKGFALDILRNLMISES